MPFLAGHSSTGVISCEFPNSFASDALKYGIKRNKSLLMTEKITPESQKITKI